MVCFIAFIVRKPRIRIIDTFSFFFQIFVFDFYFDFVVYFYFFFFLYFFLYVFLYTQQIKSEYALKYSSSLCKTSFRIFCLNPLLSTIYSTINAKSLLNVLQLLKITSNNTLLTGFNDSICYHFLFVYL